MLRVLEVATADGTEWLLTNDPATADEFVGGIKGTVVADHDPDDILNSQYQGLALLSSC